MKIHIIRRPESLATELYLYEISDDKRTITSFNAKENGEVIGNTKQLNEGEAIDTKPLMILMENEMRSFIKAVLDYSKDEGYKVPEEVYVAGKLESQTEHLKDLRKLLKL